jgi:hypothetical protein
VSFEECKHFLNIAQKKRDEDKYYESIAVAKPQLVKVRALFLYF